MCGFCLTTVDGDNYPDKCVCEMVKCCKCGTWLKARNGEKPKFCYGCATVDPEVRVDFNSTTNTSCCYMEEAWRKRNLGRDCKDVYFITTGWKNVDSRRNGEPKSSWISMAGDSAFINVRELTCEEKEKLKK